MAVPLITFVTPPNGPTRGDMIIEIWGGHFRLPPIPATTPTVSVTFGGVASPLVEVIASSLLYVTVPAHDAGVVDLVVKNLDAHGAPIAGELVTAAAAFTYQIPLLTAEYSSDLVRMVRVLLRALKQQTLAKEVVRPVHTDFDDTTGDQMNIAKLAALPSLTVLGPELKENRFYTDNELPTVELDLDGDGDMETFVQARTPFVGDLIFTIVGVSDRDTEALNLMSSFILFMRRNIYLYVDRLEGRPDLGQAKFEFDYVEDGAPQMPGPNLPNNSTIAQWSARVVIRGFTFEELAGVNTGLVPGTTMPRHAVIAQGGTVLSVQVDHPEQIDDD